MKKLISAILAALMLLSCLSFFVVSAENGESTFSLYQRFRTEKTFFLGDADGNRYVNAKDAYAMKAFLAGFDGEIRTDSADIMADGKITAKDVYYLKAAFSGAVSLDSFEGDTQVYKFTIAGKDISEFTIVLPEDTKVEDNLYFAYETFWKYTEKATGVTVPMVYGETDSDSAIYFHNVPEDSELGEELGFDGYIYKVENGNFHIYGARRGNMYAVYEILEDHLGFFFCENYYTYQYKIRYVEFEEGFFRKYVPPYRFRYSNHGFWGSTSNFFAKARGNLSQVGLEKANCHSFSKYQTMGAGILPEEGSLNPDGTVMTTADRYYAKYEDGLKNGVQNGKVSSADRMDEHGPQPCTVNEEEYANIYEGMLNCIELTKAIRPGFDISDKEVEISFSINDNQIPCNCKICYAKVNGTDTKVNTTVRNLIEKYYTGEYTIKDGRVYFHKEGMNGLYLDYMNRAAKQLREVYPDATFYQILYGYEVPETVRPLENCVFHYCSQIGACFRHAYGENEKCKGNVTVSDNVHSSKLDEEAIKEWIKICHEHGSEIEYWFYPESYIYFYFDMPFYNVLYKNAHWLYEQGIDGITYEGANTQDANHNFELLRAYLATELAFHPDMTYEEYVGYTKKYLAVRYGEGYEHVFNYMTLLEKAGSESDYCCAYWFPLFDFYSKASFRKYYREMRSELLMAIEESTTEKYTCEKLLAMCDFAGMSAVYDQWYTNGDEASRKEYEEIYNHWYTWMDVNNIKVVGNAYDLDSSYKFPDKPDLSCSPCIKIYKYEFRAGRHDDTDDT